MQLIWGQIVDKYKELAATVKEVLEDSSKGQPVGLSKTCIQLANIILELLKGRDEFLEYLTAEAQSLGLDTHVEGCVNPKLALAARIALKQMEDEAKLAKMQKALEKIRDMDYRGNIPRASIIAKEALEENVK